MATNNLLDMPKRANGIQRKVVKDYRREYITVDGYSLAQQKILGATNDDIELEVDFKTYDRMGNDATIQKATKIIITNVLADDLQMAPGATEDEVTEEEYAIYEEVMAFCQRAIATPVDPLRLTLEQILYNGITYGHGISEIEWDYRIDGISKRPSDNKTPKNKSRFSAMMERWGLFSKADSAPDPSIKRPSLRSEQKRLMPVGIKVKPRGSALFVVDDYYTVLGLTPRNNGSSRASIAWNEIIDRDKFMILTMNKRDEDPRGRSSLRPAFNWYNLKSQVPAEMLRFILQESVPQAVGTLAQDAPAFEFERDENENIVYETDPITGLVTSQPKMLTATESMGRQIEGFRGGSGAVIPYGAKLEPFKKNTSSDADFFGKILKVVDNQMENAILLQTLAQSEGEHQARSASQQVAELLHNLVFWIRWLLAVMIVTDLLETTVRINLGEWALRYMPMVSLGDFVRRDWAHDLEVISKAYFYGFIDDTQRAELMAWMNLPRPGPSRQELGLDATAQADINGDPAMPNQQRPDKTKGNKNRNAGNGTEKKNGNTGTKNNTTSGFSPLNALGHHGRRVVGYSRNLFTSSK